MTHSSKSVRFIVMRSDSPKTTGAQSEDQKAEIAWVDNLEDLQNQLENHSPEGVVLGGKDLELKDLATLNPSIDLSKTTLLAGPFSDAVGVTKLGHFLGKGEPGKGSGTSNHKLTLEDFVEAKLEEFVRAMKVGAARSLYPTFMRAVERPLIELALRETNGNQIQASQLLGINRNTLRKKIGEFNISVKRRPRTPKTEK